LLVGSQGRLSRPRAGKPAMRFRSLAPRNDSSGLPGVADALLVLDQFSRSVLGWWSLPSLYLHDTIYDPDSRALFAVDSDTGKVLRLSLDSSPPGDGPVGRLPLSPGPPPVVPSGYARLSLHRSYDSVPVGGLVPRMLGPMRARAAHANNVAVALGHLWVMHNNMARTSALQLVDLTTGEPRATLRLGGPNCHNPCFYSGRVLYLLSSSGGLGMLHPNGSSHTLFQAGPSWFSKGLAVVDHVAYFGLAPKQRSGVERNWADSQLAAFALLTGRLLWRRLLPFTGLVNSVSAPLLASYCSWRACDTEGRGDHLPRKEEWRQLVNW
jgi:outer membrane protein assembly factor BamB